MNEIEPKGKQMSDRVNVLAKALNLRLWYFQCWGTPHQFDVGFDLKVSTYLDFTRRKPRQDLAQIKLALMKGIRTLKDKLKEVEEYEHNK